MKDQVDRYQVEQYYLEIISELVPELNLLFGRIVTLPLCTVECERGFSKFSIIKTKLRNLIEGPVLDRLMKISLMDLNKTRKFNFVEAYSNWESQKKRTGIFKIL